MLSPKELEPKAKRKLLFGILLLMTVGSLAYVDVELMLAARQMHEIAQKMETTQARVDQMNRNLDQLKKNLHN
jgi:outer membrane lipoprotein-sorting protein